MSEATQTPVDEVSAIKFATPIANLHQLSNSDMTCDDWVGRALTLYEEYKKQPVREGEDFIRTSADDGQPELTMVSTNMSHWVINNLAVIMPEELPEFLQDTTPYTALLEKNQALTSEKQLLEDTIKTMRLEVDGQQNNQATPVHGKIGNFQTSFINSEQETDEQKPLTKEENLVKFYEKNKPDGLWALANYIRYINLEFGCKKFRDITRKEVCRAFKVKKYGGWQTVCDVSGANPHPELYINSRFTDNGWFTQTMVGNTRSIKISEKGRDIVTPAILPILKEIVAARSSKGKALPVSEE